MRTSILKFGLLILLTITTLNAWASESSAENDFKEAEINLESWMSEIIIFDSNLLELSLDEIQLENWMAVIFLEVCQYENFPNQNSKNTIEENSTINDSETDPEIEPWMFKIMVK